MMPSKIMLVLILGLVTVVHPAFSMLVPSSKPEGQASTPVNAGGASEPWRIEGMGKFAYCYGWFFVIAGCIGIAGGLLWGNSPL